jgi:hypothetical protein
MQGDNGKAEPKSRRKQRLIFFRGSIKKSSARVNMCIVFKMKNLLGCAAVYAGTVLLI